MRDEFVELMSEQYLETLVVRKVFTPEVPKEEWEMMLDEWLLSKLKSNSTISSSEVLAQPITIPENPPIVKKQPIKTIALNKPIHIPDGYELVNLQGCCFTFEEWSDMVQGKPIFRIRKKNK